MAPQTRCIQFFFAFPVVPDLGSTSHFPVESFPSEPRESARSLREPFCRTGVSRGNPPVRRGKRPTAEGWAAGIRQFSAGTVLPQRGEPRESASSPRESASSPREPFYRRGVGRGNPHPVWSFKSIKSNGVGGGGAEGAWRRPGPSLAL